MGLLVRDAIIDFDVLFELLPFAHKLWTDTSEFRNVMQEVTYADFWLHFQYLRERYIEALNMREPPKHKAEVLRRLRKKDNKKAKLISVNT